MATYTAGHGTKLEYSATENGTYKRLYAVRSIPEVGGSPERIDSTTLDNTDYRTSITGLMPEVSLDIPFALDTESAYANLKEVKDMKDSGNEYYFKITYTSGVVVSFKSAVKFSVGAASPDTIQEFTMHLSPVGEPVITVPTTSL